jgi:hypothetical protein
LLKMLSLKATAVAVLAAGAGGVAVAASTGVLPNPVNPHSSTTHSQAPGKGGAASPSPSVVGLCTAYRSGAGADHGNALESPAFQALITAAGGKDLVDAFCTGILGTPAPPAHPTGPPTAHPTGEPTDHSSRAPNGHPTGPPSNHPGS